MAVLNTVAIVTVPDRERRASTLVDRLRCHAREQPRRPACTVLDDGEREAGRRTFAELDARARAIAAWLGREGFARKRVVLLIKDSLKFVEAFVGCLYAGVVAVPLAVPRRGRSLTQLRAICRDVDAAAVIAGPVEISYLRPGLADNLPTVGWLSVDAADGSGDDWQADTIDPEDLALLQYTSGSTGMPKGVMVTHANLMHNGATLERAMGVSRESRCVGWLPLYHDMGLIGNVLQPLYTGFEAVLMLPPAFIQRPVRWLNAITRYGGTVAGAPNFAYDLCVDRIPAGALADLDLRTWTVAYCGSEPVRARTLDRFATAFAPANFKRSSFLPCYGLAENTLFATGGPPGRGPEVLHADADALARGTLRAAAEDRGGVPLVSCGAVPVDEQLLIVDPETAVPVTEGVVGEVWLRGRSVCAGYFRKPMETTAVFSAHLSTGGEERFLRTGDFGVLHEGRLSITGRLDDLIIVRGRNHYPQDLEAAAERSHELLRKGGGIAVAIQADGRAALAIAHELTRDGCAAADRIEVASAIREAVAGEHGLHVDRVFLLRPGQLPRTTSGKVRRSACRTMIVAGDFDGCEATSPAAATEPVS
jgi:acyl-CoA synthetase (AMP-forming)/AMP-acid ligase II